MPVQGEHVPCGYARPGSDRVLFRSMSARFLRLAVRLTRTILHQLARSVGIQQDCNRIPGGSCLSERVAAASSATRGRVFQPTARVVWCDDGHTAKVVVDGGGLCALVSGFAASTAGEAAAGGSRTFDGKHDISTIDLTVVYFVPKDRTPLPDWRERVDYFMKRIEAFHRRESAGRSTLHILVHPRPLIIDRTSTEIRGTDPNQTFDNTTSKVRTALGWPGHASGIPHPAGAERDQLARTGRLPPHADRRRRREARGERGRARPALPGRGGGRCTRRRTTPATSGGSGSSAPTAGGCPTAARTASSTTKGSATPSGCLTRNRPTIP